MSINGDFSGCKWAWVSGDCCGEWSIEFRSGYHTFDSKECIAWAEQAWNEAPKENNNEIPE